MLLHIFKTNIVSTLRLTYCNNFPRIWGIGVPPSVKIINFLLTQKAKKWSNAMKLIKKNGNNPPPNPRHPTTQSHLCEGDKK